MEILLQNIDSSKDILLFNQARTEAACMFFVGYVDQLEDEVELPSFVLRAMRWKILVTTNQTGLSVFVKCRGLNGSPNWSCNAAIKLRLMPNVPSVEPYVQGPFTHLFNGQENEYVYPNFIEWPKPEDTVEAYAISEGIWLEVHVNTNIPQGLEN